MQKAIITVLAVCVSLLATAATAGTIAPALQEQLATAAADQPVSVIVHFTEQAPIKGISQDLSAAQGHAQAAARGNRSRTEGRHPSARNLWPRTCSPPLPAGGVIGFTSYWIANLMVVQAVPAEIERIAARSDVDVRRTQLRPRTHRTGGIPPGPHR